MGPDAIVGQLVNLGTGGAVIIALVYFWRAKETSDKFLMERIDKIVDRHLEAEKANRDQVREISTQNRDLFDRVIAICNDLSSAVRDLRDATRSNEAALKNHDATTRAIAELTEANRKQIDELRIELVKLKGA